MKHFRIIESDEEIQSSVNVLKTYSSFVSSLKLREQFTISNPAQFCKVNSSRNVEYSIITEAESSNNYLSNRL